MTISLIKYSQNQQDFFIGVMSARQIIDNSEVLIFNQHVNGYQRAPNQPHVNKIKNYILNSDDFLLPTAIMLGIDSDLIDVGTNGIHNVQTLNIKPNAVFRIVDGQHRIEGLKKAIERKKEIENLSLPVILIVTNPSRRSIELEIFTDINSKAKRINTDLAQLAKHNYEIIENEINEANINMHIALKTAFILKENDASVWYNAIKFNIQTDFNIGVIGVSMFSNSILKIVETFKNRDNSFDYDNRENIIKQCDSLANDIAKFIDTIWSDYIFKKWESAFSRNYTINEFGENTEFRYNTKYYIQKGIGTNSINGLIAEVISKKSLENTLKTLEARIKNSKIKTEDWQVGGEFSGFNSAAGFKKIKELL